MSTVDPGRTVDLELRCSRAAEDMFMLGDDRETVFAAMRAEFSELDVATIDRCVEDAQRRSAKRKADKRELWPEPREIPNGLAPVEQFQPYMLPEALRGWIEDIAQRAATPPDYAATAAMVGAASLIGRRITIRPHPKDSWTVVPNLWGAAVGRSGVLKSPTVKEALKPLKRLEVEASEAYGKASEQYQAHVEVVKALRKPSKSWIEKQRKAGRDAEDIAREITEEEEPDKPPRRRYLVNDTTYERLGEILQDNPHGTLIYRDELVGLLRQLEREGQETARAFYLEAWSGDGRYEFNRIGRGDTIIGSCGFCLYGSIQPGPLRTYLRGAVAGAEGADGLVQRFQLAVWPDAADTWKYLDRYPDTEAKSRAFEVFQRLATMDPDDLGGMYDQFDPDRPYLRFDAEAHDAFLAWRSDLEKRIRSGDEHPAVESHLSKYRSLLPAIALVSHLVDGRTGDVDLDAVVRADSWVSYLESHARRLYGAVMTEDTYPARMLLQHILAGDLEDGFTARDVYRNCWAGLGTKDDVGRATELLVSLDWIHQEAGAADPKHGGRPTTRFRINPMVLEA